MKVLIIIDMQNDFIDGTLGTKEAVSIIPYIKKKIEEYQMNGNEIVYTRDTHTVNYLNTQEGKKLPVEHCIVGTDGWKIHKDLVIENAKIFDKPTFGSVDLANYFMEREEKMEFELVGVCTDICVISNAMLLKAYYPESTIRVDAKGCAGVTVESHKNALNAMKMCQIEIIE